MKQFKKLFILLIISIVFSTLHVLAVDSLTIDSKSYDKNTAVFTVSGTAQYDEVMVSLFDGDELLSFKTVSVSNHNYTATFNISFGDNKTITIKVGDINSTDYKLSSLDVEKTVAPTKPKKLTDSLGNYLQILDPLKTFEFGDELDIDIIDDFSLLNDSDRGKIEAIENKLGSSRRLFAIMSVGVINGGSDVDIDDITDGYKLFLSVDEDYASAFRNPHLARILDLQTCELGSGKKFKYDSEEGGMIVTLNNGGYFIIYEDLAITNSTSSKNSKNPSTGDKIFLYVTLSVLSLVGLGTIGIHLKKKRN